jgi:hypothetical protein
MKTIDNAQFGDILLADVIFNDHSGSKIRPVVFLYAMSEDIVVLKITSQGTYQDPFIMTILPDEQNNLREISYVKLKYIGSHFKSLFIRNLGSLAANQKQKIRDTLSAFFA